MVAPATKDGQFLGTVFDIGRWHHRPDSVSAFSEHPTREVVPRVILYISPDYGAKSLIARNIEKDELSKLPGYQAVPPYLPDVQRSLSTWREGIVHFAGHASVEEKPGGTHIYSLILDDVPVDVRTLYGMPGLDVRHTLFFFNGAIRRRLPGSPTTSMAGRRSCWMPEPQAISAACGT